MSRYIDADRIDWRLIIPTNPTTAEENMIHSAKRLVERQPKADVVEVVRCKDCKWHGYLTCSNPEGIKGWVTDECFCWFAERRNDE